MWPGKFKRKEVSTQFEPVKKTRTERRKVTVTNGALIVFHRKGFEFTVPFEGTLEESGKEKVFKYLDECITAEWFGDAKGTYYPAQDIEKFTIYFMENEIEVDVLVEEEATP